MQWVAHYRRACGCVSRVEAKKIVELLHFAIAPALVLGHGSGNWANEIDRERPLEVHRFKTWCRSVSRNCDSTSKSANPRKKDFPCCRLSWRLLSAPQGVIRIVRQGGVRCPRWFLGWSLRSAFSTAVSNSTGLPDRLAPRVCGVRMSSRSQEHSNVESIPMVGPDRGGRDGRCRAGPRAARLRAEDVERIPAAELVARLAGAVVPVDVPTASVPTAALPNPDAASPATPRSAATSADVPATRSPRATQPSPPSRRSSKSSAPRSEGRPRRRTFPRYSASFTIPTQPEGWQSGLMRRS